MTREPVLMTTAEVADLLRVHPSTVTRWAAIGTLPTVRIGRELRFRRDDVDALTASTKAAS